MNKLDYTLYNNSKKNNSFYVLDIDRFKKDVNVFLGSFKKLYCNTEIAYSFKTNYIPELCNEIKKQDSEQLTGWIIDLRFNGGGNMWPMLLALSYACL